MEWISVEDRLPRDCEDVLVPFRQEVCKGFYEYKWKTWIVWHLGKTWSLEAKDINCWMALPDLPEPPEDE